MIMSSFSILGLAFMSMSCCLQRFAVVSYSYDGEINSINTANHLHSYHRHLRYVESSRRTLQQTNNNNDTAIALDIDSASSTHSKDSNENTIGSMYTKLVFDNVSSQYAESELLTGYIQYGVTRVINDNLDADIELVDVIFQPLNTPEIWLSYPVMISLKYPSGRNDVFAHVDGILSSNIGDISLYQDDYVETTSLSNSDEMELELMFKDVFIQEGRVETSEEDDPTPTQAPTPKKTTFTKPVNAWINKAADTTADSLSTMPYWGWIIIGCGLGFMAMCCCGFTFLYFMRRRSDAARKEESAAVHQATKPKTISQTDSHEREETGKPITVEENKEQTTVKQVPEPKYTAGKDQGEVTVGPQKETRDGKERKEQNHDETKDEQKPPQQAKKHLSEPDPQVSEPQISEQQPSELDPEVILPEPDERMPEVLPALYEYPNPEPRKKSKKKKKKAKKEKDEEGTQQLDEEEMSFEEWLQHATTKKSTKKDKKKKKSESSVDEQDINP